MNKEVLVVEISGKRPGSSKQRPTEKFHINYDHLIISNNSENYNTDWKIINVPKDYEEYYKSKFKSSDNAWYAPMNRSYAIKYAKEHGYKYLIQLDDNINQLKLAYILENKNSKIKYSVFSSKEIKDDMINDFIDLMVELLKQSNAGMVGLNMVGASLPDKYFIAERFCYSFFALKLSVVPNEFQGDFEDDIDYKLKLQQMNIPALQFGVLMYGKTAQGLTKDLTGCRKEYLKAGLKRGEHMKKLYGDVYRAGLSSRTNRVGKQQITEQKYFRHRLKCKYVGYIIKNKKIIFDKFNKMLKKYSKYSYSKIS